MRTFMIAALVAAVFAQDALSPCATAREEALAKDDPALFVPECLPDGSFAQQQCTDISEDEEECWCVDVTGQKLDVDVSECEMCSLMYKAMVAQEADDMYLPDCDDDGSFASIQCFGEDCFCCDAWTGQLDADLTLCQDDDEDDDDDDDEDEDEDESCFEEYELGLEKGDLWLPTCNDDGTYAARQCFEETCYCYDADTGDLTPDLTACPVEEDDQTTEGTQEATEATDADEEATENNEEATEATDANVETTEDNEEATEAAEQMIGDDIATDDDDEEDEDEDEEEEGFSVGPSAAGAAILGVAMVGIASFVVVKRRSQEPDASAYTMQV